MRYVKFSQVMPALLLTSIIATPMAAEVRQVEANARFSIIETADGFLRLDQKNGNISICKAENGQMICKLGADERRAYEHEIDSINQRLDKMSVRLNALEAQTGGTGSLPNSAQKKSTREEEFERALKFADRAFRQFFGMIQELKKEEKQEKKDAI